MTLVEGVHHVAIKAVDVERVATFYREVLGLPETRRQHEEGGALRSIWLETGGVILMIERSATPALPRGEGVAELRRDPPGLHLIALRIRATSRARVRTRLAESGVAVVFESDYTLYVLDPEGNRVGLSSYPEREP